MLCQGMLILFDVGRSLQANKNIFIANKLCVCVYLYAIYEHVKTYAYSMAWSLYFGNRLLIRGKKAAYVCIF